MSKGDFKNILRLAIIEKVHWSEQTVTIRMLDRIEDRTYKCPLPQPAVMDTGGIFISPKSGTTVIVGFGYNEAPYIVSFMPKSPYSQDLTQQINTLDFALADQEYPTLKTGEMALLGLAGSKVFFNEDGDINFGSGDSFLKMTSDDIISSKASSKYWTGQAGRAVHGRILRDVRKKVRKIEEVDDKLSDPNFDTTLSPIGRNPTFGVSSFTNGEGDTRIIRNPTLVESRELIYEYALDDDVEDFTKEVDKLGGGTTPDLTGINRRSSCRADVLNLNPVTKNSLMEVVKGTLVDRYGKILDINRNQIKFNAIENEKDGVRLAKEEELLRRSVKFHFEINNRKPTTKDVEYDKLDKRTTTSGVETANNGHVHSRFSVDVDSEGLVKMNVPASSDTGNIPLLTRYVNTSMKNNNQSWDFRDENYVDVLHLAHGELSEDGGVDVKSPGYVPQNVAADGQDGAGQVIKYRTAWHDLPSTAEELFDSEGAVSQVLTNVAGGSISPNAGGRSFHANLDGSIELNVGRDSADGKSIVLDTHGGVVSRIGKDKRGNSVVSQLDGNVKVKVGGDTTSTDSKLVSPSVKFFVETSNGNHEIEANEEGIFIRSATGKNLVIGSGGNLVLKSEGQTLIAGETIVAYGTADDEGNNIAGERLIERSGKSIK